MTPAANIAIQCTFPGHCFKIQTINNINQQLINASHDLWHHINTKVYANYRFIWKLLLQSENLL